MTTADLIIACQGPSPPYHLITRLTNLVKTVNEICADYMRWVLPPLLPPLVAPPPDTVDPVQLLALDTFAEICGHLALPDLMTLRVVCRTFEAWLVPVLRARARDAPCELTTCMTGHISFHRAKTQASFVIQQQMQQMYLGAAAEAKPLPKICAGDLVTQPRAALRFGAATPQTDQDREDLMDWCLPSDSESEHCSSDMDCSD